MLGPLAEWSWLQLDHLVALPLRHLTHTGGSHGTPAALTERALSNGWELTQLNPPHRALRQSRLDDKALFDPARRRPRAAPRWPRPAVPPRWEDRLVRVTIMTTRNAPYLRYHGTRRPKDDQRAHPLELIKFDGSLAVERLLRAVPEDLGNSRYNLPVHVTGRRTLARDGPVCAVWPTAKRDSSGSGFGEPRPAACDRVHSRRPDGRRIEGRLSGEADEWCGLSPQSSRCSPGCQNRTERS